MVKKSKKFRKLSAKKLYNQKYILLGIVSVFIVLFIAKIEFLKKPELANNVIPLVSPVKESVTATPTIQQIAKKVVVYPTYTPTPTPTPSGVKTIRGHYVDENLQPITIPGQNVRVLNDWTKEDMKTFDQPNWNFQLKVPGDYYFFAPNLPGYTTYVTSKVCFGDSGCSAPEKSTTCISSLECNSNPDHWKSSFYRGWDDNNKYYVVIKEGEIAEIYYMYKKN